MRDNQGRMVSRPLVDRFPEHVQEPFDPHNDCWEWIGTKTGSGYGQIWLNAHDRECAHRVAYEMFVEPIPEGFHVDHLCGNRACVRPDHLQAIPRKENVSQWNLSKTHCINGHPYSGDNLRLKPSGERRCRICHNAQERARNMRKRGLKP